MGASPGDVGLALATSVICLNSRSCSWKGSQLTASVLLSAKYLYYFLELMQD